jgi:tRNA (guanine26-N2/guanine27-N2)-dimethyltransferase
MMDNYYLVTEGSAEIYVPYVNTYSNSPGKKSAMPFYNPAMKTGRDFTLLAISSWKSNVKDPKIIDGLAGCGVRGIRVMKELGIETLINDRDQASFSIIKKNLIHNKLPTSLALNHNLNEILNREPFSYVDIDPFGSPVPFLDAALQSVHINGMIGITATDLAALFGTAKKALYRKYWAYNDRNYLSKEIGARILIANIALRAMPFDKYIKPLLTLVQPYYIRVFVQVTKHTKEKFIGYVNDTKISKKQIGPLWMGTLHDKKFIEEIMKNKLNDEITSMLKIMYDDSIMEPFYYDTIKVAQDLNVDIPNINEVLVSLKTMGFKATRTVFSYTGFKTTAPIEEVYNTFRYLASHRRT